MDFISWIEIVRDGKTRILYLTDKEIFSEIGKEKLMDVDKNDTLSHYAAKTFYGIPFNEGIHKIVYDFWNTEKLPTEIAEKIKNFDAYWGKCLRNGYFRYKNYEYILLCAPKEWKDKFAEKILKDIGLGVTNEFFTNEHWLIMIMNHCSEEYQNDASQKILDMCPTKENLIHIINHGPFEFREKACDILLSDKSLGTHDLINLVNISPESKKGVAFEMIKEKDLGEEEIERFSSPEWRQKAIEFLRKPKKEGVK